MERRMVEAHTGAGREVSDCRKASDWDTLWEVKIGYFASDAWKVGEDIEGSPYMYKTRQSARVRCVLISVCGDEQMAFRCWWLILFNAYSLVLLIVMDD